MVERKAGDFFQTGWKGLAVLLLMAFSFQARADITILGDTGWPDDEVEEDKPREFKVLPVVLPAYPKEEDLLPFEIGPTQSLKFFLDAKSISISGQDEVRYTLVAKSSTGALNISYEGLRCASKEYRRFAYADRKGEWTMSKSEAWRPINWYSANRPRAVLWLDYFCDEAHIEGPAEMIVKRLRYNEPLQKENKYNAG